MFFILFGDPRLVPQESLLLKSTMTYSGMQHINMTSTMLQNTRKGKLSFPNKLIHLMNLTMIQVKTLYLIKKRMFLPYSIFQSSFNSPEPQNPTKVVIPNQLWGEFPEAAKKLIIEYNKKILQHFNGGNPKHKPTLG